MLAYSGRGRFVTESIDLNEFVEEMSHLLHVAVSKKTALQFNFAKNLPILVGDATQIRQVIMNLITNAAEAIGEEDGVITLSTGSMSCDRAYLDKANMAFQMNSERPPAEGVYVYVDVSDTGCGMDDRTMEKVFDPFFSTKFPGRGLGMAAVLGIVRGHNGAIKIDSEVGRGTTFKVLFPASDKRVVKDEASERRDSEAREWRGRGTVLVADDEESVRRVAEQMLARLGFTILSAADGREAVEVFREHAGNIVCVLLDLTMPRLDGEQVFSELRRIRPDAKVILSSGYDEQDVTQRFIGKGLVGFIQKPYTLKNLIPMMREVLEAS
jgi:CheY-like chemotaxis protein